MSASGKLWHCTLLGSLRAAYASDMVQRSAPDLNAVTEAFACANVTPGGATLAAPTD